MTIEIDYGRGAPIERIFTKFKIMRFCKKAYVFYTTNLILNSIMGFVGLAGFLWGVL